MLNPAQQQAVEADGHSVVIALPGSGKTHLSVQKIDRLLKQHQTAFIAAVTFTRDAASELDERILKVSGEKDRLRVKVGTFHRHAIAMLRQADKMPNIASGPKQFAMIRRALETAESDMKPFEAMLLIEHIKCGIEQTPETTEAEKIYRAYTDLLNRHGMCDLQDVVRLALDGMRSGRVPPRPVQYMLVDEFQDTDAVQLAWVYEHAKHGVQITAVGDDDQSIYGWRHALGYSGMTQFRAETDATLITLNSNYRCRKEILDAAERLVRNNKKRVDKIMLAEKGAGGKVNAYQYAERGHEFQGLIKAILATPGIKQEVVGEGENAPRLWVVPEDSWAVLTRNNFLLRAISAELTVAGIAHRLPADDKDIWAVSPLVHLIDLLEVLTKNSAVGLENILSLMGVEEADIARMHAASNGRARSMLKQPDLLTDSDKKTKEQALKLFRLVDGWKEQFKVGRIGLGLQGICSFLTPLVPDKQRPELEYGTNILANRLRGTLGERLRVIQKKNENKEEIDKNVVRLMTMHGSKGLEFTNVWLPVVEAGVIPSEGGGEMSDLEEERRLFYVAMTRAKETLTISCNSLTSPSFFISETGIPLQKITLQNKIADNV